MSIVPGVIPSAGLLRRIRGEYLEMPGLRVTARQAQRLFGLDPSTCDGALDELVQSGFLWRAGNGMFRLTTAADQEGPDRSR